jgi:Xaa-Pro dipeptidase
VTVPHRLDRLRAALSERGLDAAVAAGTEPVDHLCGYWRYFGSPPAFVLDGSGETTLVVQSDEADEARRGGFADRIAAYGARGFGLVPDQLPLLLDALVALPVVAGGARIGVAGGGARLAASLAERIPGAVEGLDEELAAIALVKDRDELERIADAYALAWTGQRAVRDAYRSGISEIELFTAGLAAAQNAAGEPIAFAGDLLCGSRTAEVCAPVRVAGRAPVGDGDVVIADLVVGRGGYFGDTADTVAPDGTEAAAVREELLQILERSSRQLVPGATGDDLFRAMHDAITDAFPEGEFPHHGGHGVGLTPFEDPHVIPGDRTPFAPGMVMALEPGVYFPGRFGVRVEGMYVVGEDGAAEIAKERS